MKLLSNCIALLALGTGALANPVDEHHILEPRRAASCTNYPAANAKLTQCATNTRYCTNFLGRGPNTATSYTTTIRKTYTPTVVTVRSTTTTRTFTSTVYTSTMTVTAATPSVTTVTSTSTTSVTHSVTATVSSTESDTLTVSTSATTTSMVTSTATVPDIPCTSVNQKRAEITPAPILARAALTPVSSKCGMTTLSDRAISGACGCLIDKTIFTAFTSTLAPSFKTVAVSTSGTTTISTVSTVTTTPTITSTVTSTLTTTVATTTVSTSTVYPFTTTVATITTTVGTVTESKTSTVTETSVQPRCTQDDRNSYDDGPTFVSSCDTNFVGYTVETTDATDMFDCTYKCNTYNNLNKPYSCVGISFNQAQCNNNCQFKSGINTTAVASDPNFESARMLSPAIVVWGNDCQSGVNSFGDVRFGYGSVPYVLLCGMDLLYNDYPCATWPRVDQEGPQVEGSCWDTAPSANGTVYAIAYVESTNGGGAACCPKFYGDNAVYTYNQPGYDVDIAVRIQR